eukprot:XP_027324751.1 uncharacterized protein LOC101802132 isoform X2 [Anas platyrhynchos]
MGLPHAVAFGGSFQKNTCNIDLLMNLQYDGKTVDVQMDTSCKNKYAFQGMLRLSVPWTSQLGLPFENSVLFSASTESTTGGILLLQAGKCKLKARGDLCIQNKAEWTLETECQLLQDLGAPVKIDGSGYILMDKMNLDSQTFIIVDESKLQVLLILNITDIREELSLVQKLGVVSLNYKLTHNIEALKALQVEERIELQVSYQTLTEETRT